MLYLVPLFLESHVLYTSMYIKNSIIPGDGSFEGLCTEYSIGMGEFSHSDLEGEVSPIKDLTGGTFLSTTKPSPFYSCQRTGC